MKTKFYQTDQELKDRMIKRFVRYVPGYLELAMNLNQTEIEEIADEMDHFEFHFRHYVSGVDQTLKPILKATRTFANANGCSIVLAESILTNVEKDILNAELYELMPRHIKAKRRVLKEVLIQKTLQNE